MINKRLPDWAFEENVCHFSYLWTSNDTIRSWCGRQIELLTFDPPRKSGLRMCRKCIDNFDAFNMLVLWTADIDP